mgnify:CR=1 FL=1
MELTFYYYCDNQLKITPNKAPCSIKFPICYWWPDIFLNPVKNSVPDRRGHGKQITVPLNSHDDNNDYQEDEELITEFATFICLALHHAKLYDKLRRSENSVAVAHEVKAYHAQAMMVEVEDIAEEGPPNPEDNQDVSSQM